MALTARRKRFVEEYPVDLNATQAAVRAGFSAKTAYSQGQRLLKNVEVAAAIKKALDVRAEKVELTQEYVLDNLTEVLERCMQRAPVMVRKGRGFVQLQDADGRDVWQFDARGVVAAAGLLGKHLGIFSENVNLRTPDGPIEISVTRKVVPASNRIAKQLANGKNGNGNGNGHP